MGGLLAGARVLVVESDTVIAETMQRFIEVAGGAVTVARSAQEAMTGGTFPWIDAAVVAAELPDGRGTDLVRLLGHQLPADRIFIVSNFHYAPASQMLAGDDGEVRPLTMVGLLRTLSVAVLPVCVQVPSRARRAPVSLPRSW